MCLHIWCASRIASLLKIRRITIKYFKIRYLTSNQLFKLSFRGVHIYIDVHTLRSCKRGRRGCNKSGLALISFTLVKHHVGQIYLLTFDVLFSFRANIHNNFIDAFYLARTDLLMIMKLAMDLFDL